MPPLHRRPPLVRELLVAPDVIGAFGSIARLPYPILFDSATAVSDVARYSFMSASPRTIVRGGGRSITLQDRDTGTIVHEEGRALDVVARILYEGGIQEASDPELPPFQGGAAGYVGYEYGGVLERLPQPRADLELPDVVMGIYEWTIAWDHLTGRSWIFAETLEMLEMVASLIHDVPPAVSPTIGTTTLRETSAATQFTSTFTRPTYEHAVERVREYIRAGDIFQANLSQRFSAPLRTSPWSLYRTLRTINPAPFASYFDVGNMVIASVSPERFLQANASGHVETRPIKGTRPRSTDPILDDAQRDELIRSEKDAAEHVMIVDVLRNDLSRVCEYGSVRVPTLMDHERHPTVHHLVSTITGQLRSGMTAIDLVHAAFPGGSITGAPKIRAMEIIAELEPVTRGVYCGAIGYISVTGAMDTSIAIRTCVVHNDHVYFSAGGGIVADSDPAAEYEETIVKATALRQAIIAANTSTVSLSAI